MLQETIENYKSDIKLGMYKNKLYIDPEFGKPLPRAAVNYAIFSSKWDIEEVKEDNVLKIIHRESGDSISLAFNSLKDKIDFVKSIYASQPVKQIGKGMDIEKFANENLKPKSEFYLNSVIKRLVTNSKKDEFKN